MMLDLVAHVFYTKNLLDARDGDELRMIIRMQPVTIGPIVMARTQRADDHRLDLILADGKHRQHDHLKCVAETPAQRYIADMARLPGVSTKITPPRRLRAGEFSRSFIAWPTDQPSRTSEPPRVSSAAATCYRPASGDRPSVRPG
jgi:hypothetical protein